MTTRLKSIAFVATVAAATLTALTALADPPVDPAVAESAPGVLHLAPRTIYGRPNRPMVVIEVRTPSAADAAGAAHESVRASLLNRAEPAAMHPTR
jgi:hypothetical protein